MLNVRVACSGCNQKLAWLSFLIHGIYDEECEVWKSNDWQTRMATLVMMGQWGIPIPNHILMQVKRDAEGEPAENESPLVSDHVKTSVEEWDNS